MSKPSLTGRHAEVAGAGLAGLATAAALAQRGWSVRLHEQGSELREIGAGIYLFDNALRALAAIGAYDEVAARAEDIRQMELRDHRNNLVREGHFGDGRLFIALRGDLHAALVNAAVRAGVDIVTNSRALAADPDGRLEFAKGFGDRADLVVGSDGVYSSVRDSLRLADSIVDLQDGCGRHLIPREPGDPVQRTIEVWSAGRRLGVAPASPEHVYLFLCCPAADIAWRNQQPFEPGAWLDSHPWYHRQLERIPRHPEGRWISFYDVRCRSWSAGRVALVGDAAHAMSPNLGQGACVALANGIALADAVSAAADIPRALRAWERSERPIVDLTQRYSYLYGAVGTKWPRLTPLLDLRTSLVRSALLPILDRRTRSITADRPPATPQAVA